MARLYFVRMVSKATDENNNHAGEVVTSIYGKKEELLWSDDRDPWVNCDNLTWYFIREYGYWRECDAKRSWLYKNQVNDPRWWTDEKDIVSIDVMPNALHCATGVTIRKNF